MLTSHNGGETYQQLKATKLDLAKMIYICIRTGNDVKNKVRCKAFDKRKVFEVPVLSQFEAGSIIFLYRLRTDRGTAMASLATAYKAIG